MCVCVDVHARTCVCTRRFLGALTSAEVTFMLGFEE